MQHEAPKLSDTNIHGDGNKYWQECHNNSNAALRTSWGDMETCVANLVWHAQHMAGIRLWVHHKTDGMDFGKGQESHVNYVFPHLIIQYKS